ncbi:MAG: peptidoglycan-binding protein LysM [Flavobacteriaceae bacterium]|nr:peptidoglycan-binding protein LysM [Flavobacteriaceae bacterium]
MYKNIISYSVIPVVVFTAFYFALNTNKTLDMDMYSIKGLELDYTVTNETNHNETTENVFDYKNCISSPNLGKSFVGFKEALAFKESRGNYFIVNTYGYLGKYQFNKNTLKLIGIYNTNKFLSDPKLQEKAFIANTERNKWILRRDIKRFVGKQVGGVLITESGILAAAHLAGPGSVKKFLRSYGAIGFSDAYGTTIRNYMKRFSGYDTSFVVPNRKAKA